MMVCGECTGIVGEESSLGPVSTKSQARALFEQETVAAILSEVVEELILKPPRRLTVIGVAADRGTITLEGEVENQLLREQAQRIAQRHPAVSTVVNRLELSSGLERALPCARPNPDQLVSTRSAQYVPGRAGRRTLG